MKHNSENNIFYAYCIAVVLMVLGIFYTNESLKKVEIPIKEPQKVLQEEVVEPFEKPDTVLTILCDVYMFHNDDYPYYIEDHEILRAFEILNKQLNTVYNTELGETYPSKVFQFNLDKVYDDIKIDKTLEDYYYNGALADKLVDKEVNEDVTKMNILILPSKSVLNGFAPSLLHRPEDNYLVNYNNVWMNPLAFDSYASTLSHEIGHLVLGLNHPDEDAITKPELYKQLGFPYDNDEFNIMKYNVYNDHLTIEQQEYGFNYLINVRSELIQ